MNTENVDNQKKKKSFLRKATDTILIIWTRHFQISSSVKKKIDLLKTRKSTHFSLHHLHSFQSISRQKRPRVRFKFWSSFLGTFSRKIHSLSTLLKSRKLEEASHISRTLRSDRRRFYPLFHSSQYFSDWNESTSATEWLKSRSKNDRGTSSLQRFKKWWTRNMPSYEISWRNRILSLSSVVHSMPFDFLGRNKYGWDGITPARYAQRPEKERYIKLFCARVGFFVCIKNKKNTSGVYNI